MAFVWEQLLRNYSFFLTGGIFRYAILTYILYRLDTDQGTAPSNWLRVNCPFIALVEAACSV